MATQTKSKIKMNLESNVKTEDILQAVIIGDSFNTRFAPITHFKPRVCYFYINYQQIITKYFIICCSGIASISESTTSWIYASNVEKRWNSRDFYLQLRSFSTNQTIRSVSHPKLINY